MTQVESLSISPTFAFSIGARTFYLFLNRYIVSLMSASVVAAPEDYKGDKNVVHVGSKLYFVLSTEQAAYKAVLCALILLGVSLFIV